MNYSETRTELFQADKDIKLLSRQWITEKKQKAIFIAIHGGMAHCGDWVTPAIYFKEHGISTYAFDIRWHGTYPEYNKNGKVFFHIDGYKQNVEDIYNFYLKIRNDNPDTPVFLISHSYGAANALMLGLMYRETDIKGIIVSSPWIKNKVPIPSILRIAANLIVLINPKFAIKPASLTEHLTHDKEIIKRHYADENSGIRGTSATVKTGKEMIKLQKFIMNKIVEWNKYPLFAVIAGKDYLADPDVSTDTLKKIPDKLLTLKYYENNFHENFNELNRDEIFDEIVRWTNQYL
ncbi:MAG: alpha/beta fold hydrolase [Spirochaetes bacterium]|nr:alpha/beta fold hydrolase [Spirochaetota bacterium]